jgi:hypothetical protein
LPGRKKDKKQKELKDRSKPQNKLQFFYKDSLAEV